MKRQFSASMPLRNQYSSIAARAAKKATFWQLCKRALRREIQKIFLCVESVRCCEPGLPILCVYVSVPVALT